MNSGDILLVAGKGHEKTQDIGNKKIFFSDRKIILNAIKKKNINLSDVSLFSDGKSIYVITSNNEMLDLIKQGQAVFGISLGPIHTETEAEIHSLYPDKISATNA